ncbi:MAG: hypothetical protein ACW98U_10995 [Candidatus Thorarchaeota archaeon]|jgi:hypothetical protein
MSRILKFAIAIAAIALCLVVLSVIMFPRAFTAGTLGIPGLAMIAMVGLGAFIFVSIVYIYGFKSQR